MIKFFRKIRQKLLSEGKTGKYFKYAIGEIVLVVIGILIALQINNWNEKRKESKKEDQLIDVLITDLQSKKTEFISDLAYGKSIISKSDISINYWKENSQIDTLNLKSLLKTLAEDEWFFDENSPVYATISGSELWKQLPDSLNRQIDNMYRMRFGVIKSAFVKQSEYALNGKLNFLAPNRLLNLNESTLKIQRIVAEDDENFIILLELFKSGVIRLTSKFETTIPSIEELIENLEFYKNNK
ncbi:hypothetical protein SAMN04487989_102501 [Bizionia echini]|uniref:Uncharacterized protein n=1 Tax=Bizionia echini TaxID=649333 RepID=A0A1I5B5H5_9FLAO|nr:DUF6090 family protein [Bizionia echini]SFN69860.1 hypothetical protein SAMN04487989_102501 [Bizionia echini]